MTMVREICRALAHDTTMIIVWLFLLNKKVTLRTDLNSVMRWTLGPVR